MVVSQPQHIEQTELSVQDVVAQVAKIQMVMKHVMKDGEHYGTIKGCGDKPTLLQPGAQKIMLTFRLIPDRQVETIDLGGGHREVRVKTRLVTPYGEFRGEGCGVCSTLEAKYRWRTGPKEFTGEPVPNGYWDVRKTDPGRAQAMLGGPGYGVGKNDSGVWEIVKQGEKVEHDNPSDYWNTVTKMACKRADVHAVICATAASDLFTQDIEDLRDNGVMGHAESKPPEQTHGSKPNVAPPQRQSTGNGGNGSDHQTDDEKRAELLQICESIAAAGYTVTSENYVTFDLAPASDSVEPDALVMQICTTLGSFVGRNGKVIAGKEPEKLSAAALAVTLKKARDVHGKLPQDAAA